MINMNKKELFLKKIREFKEKHAIKEQDDQAAVTIHLMNRHSLDKNAALDHTSKAPNDEGIDGWHYDANEKTLFVYQSKLSENKSTVLKGFDDLTRAVDWIKRVLVDGQVEVPKNGCLYCLYNELSKNRDLIENINFVLLSFIDENELEDELEYERLKSYISKSKLNKNYIVPKNGKILVDLKEYIADSSRVVPQIKKYAIPVMKGAAITLDGGARLELAYIPLYRLVELYRERDYHLFDKNIRLSIIKLKKAKDRIVHPLKETIGDICAGTLNPNIFTFYHNGITISSKDYDRAGDIISLEEPTIINGCQTTTIANDYLYKLEKQHKEQEIERFKKINVIAKIVTETTEEVLKEITNANNRQQPIDDWQLFSNDRIHIQIENALKDLGIFYERQEGKFEAAISKTDNVKDYPNTNKTYIKVKELGELICLSRRELQFAAKPSLIFLNKKNHDRIFDSSILNYGKDVIFLTNLLKASKRAYTNYFDEKRKNETLDPFINKIFSKPIVKASMLYFSIKWAYCVWPKLWCEGYSSSRLDKKASSILSDNFKTIYRRIIPKMKDYYLEKSKKLEVEVSYKNLSEFLDKLSRQLGIKDEHMPFTRTSHQHITKIKI